jgi:hypothetical protein
MSCGVSDPAEQWQICVHFIAYTFSTGSDTPQNNVLRGLIPRLTKSCGVSDPTEQGPAGYQTLPNNIRKRIFCELKKNSKMFWVVNSGTIWGRFVEKTRGKKSRATVPINLVIFYAQHFYLRSLRDIGSFLLPTCSGSRGPKLLMLLL